MKRRMSNSTAEVDQETPRRRRQPQTSCNFCRSKKLKCDRAQPCFNCTSRGIPCQGQSLPPRSADVGTSASSPDVLERLSRLEEAIFGLTSGAAGENDVLDQRLNSRSEETPVPQSNRMQRERSAELDYTGGTETPVRDWETFTFRVAGSGEYLYPRQASVRCIDFPSQEDTLALLEDFLGHTRSYIVHTLHIPTVHTMVHDLYVQLRKGQEVDLGAAALVFSFSAAAAFFWDKDFPSAFNFLIADNAAAQSRAWQGVAFDLLDKCQRPALYSLDAIQAMLVLADLIYNMEGLSSRFRYLHSGARAAAYELRLHLIDFPGHESSDSEFLREMKRRIWWYLAATDWVMSVSGGPVDRVYTVNPKHMFVNRPTYIPGSDQLIPSYGEWSEMVMLHINMRIDLGEACRETTDALPLGSGGIETLPYSKAVALDRLYERILDNTPPMVSNDEFNSADEIARRIFLQRSLGKLSLHARRARMLRPLLKANHLPQQFDVLRKKCLDSTEVVMDIAYTVLSEAIDMTGTTRSHISTSARGNPYRGGLVIHHLFMACAVLAADPALRGDGAEDNPTLDAGTERRRAALANACRLLEKLGEKNTMAASMVQRLVSILRRHHVHGVETGIQGSLVSGISSGSDQESAQNPGLQVPREPQLMMTDPSAFVASQQQADLPNWNYGIVDPDEQGGIWNDFLGTNPTDDGWQQLFADLDSLSGGGMY
ncbi:hypothetical protein VM1G_01373 [Cytospora mali]|uniref:Zn(2)-C6 fungal-type domain-containing protein n=1 Tax=Cytospora mali TaxID=578113 RepID=A0A194VP57_CYTMA|nr:hypothetical protein VM1G_01373 [Valsa mali]